MMTVEKRMRVVSVRKSSCMDVSTLHCICEWICKKGLIHTIKNI